MLFKVSGGGGRLFFNFVGYSSLILLGFSRLILLVLFFVLYTTLHVSL